MIPLFGKQEVGIWRVQKRFPRYGVHIWSLWLNIRFLPSIVAGYYNVDNKLGDSKDTSTISAVNILLSASNGVRLGAFDDNVINASILGTTLNNIDQCIDRAFSKLENTNSMVNKCYSNMHKLVSRPMVLNLNISIFHGPVDKGVQ